MRTNATLAMLLAVVVVGLGVTLLVMTLVEGGGEVGLLLGLLFVVAGCGRFYLARRS